MSWIELWAKIQVIFMILGVAIPISFIIVMLIIGKKNGR